MNTFLCHDTTNTSDDLFHSFIIFKRIKISSISSARLPFIASDCTVVRIKTMITKFKLIGLASQVNLQNYICSSINCASKIRPVLEHIAADPSQGNTCCQCVSVLTGAEVQNISIPNHHGRVNCYERE